VAALKNAAAAAAAAAAAVWRGLEPRIGREDDWALLGARDGVARSPIGCVGCIVARFAPVSR